MNLPGWPLRRGGSVEARASHWIVLKEQRAMEREFAGLRLRVQLEDGGFRLYVNGEKRGFFDRSSGARAHGIWLGMNGNPGWQEPPEVTRHHAPHHNGPLGAKR